MSAVPTRLRYNDADDGMTTIGTMMTGNDDNINTVKIKNDSEGYNKVVIEGDSELQRNLPVSLNEFGTAQNGENEPEILVEVFTDDSWSVRERCYAVEGGSVDDRGNYKNSKLYGHEKYTGEKRVETGTVTSDIEAAMNELIPAGYDLQVPGDVTIPSVNNWSYKGRRENAYLELTRNYDWVLMFTSELNSSDEYIVRFEPFGYGGNEGNIVRGQDPIVYDYWKKKDTKTVISEVTVKATSPDGDSIEETVTATDPDIERSVSININYPVTVEEAQDIGDNLLQPDFLEHGKLQGPLFIDNTVNFTVGIVDDQLDINDEFTVANQEDFLHEGQTVFSFEFENEANIRQSLRNKGLQEERDSLFPSSEEGVNIDFDDFNAENGTAEADNSTSENDESPDTSGGTGLALGDNAYTFSQTSITDASITSLSVTGDAPDFSGSLETEHFIVNAGVFISSPEDDFGDFEITIENTTTNDVYFNETFNDIPVPSNLAPMIIERDPVDGDEIQTTLEIQSSGSYSATLTQTIDSIREHDHTFSGSTDSHNHSVSVLDGGHGGSGDPSEHVITGEQAEQLINLLQQLKTDRS